jgi:HK97 family phage portal protein
MSLITNITKALSRQTTPRKVEGSSVSAIGANDLRTNLKGRVGKQNAQMYRTWAEHSEWVRTAINIRRTQISSAEWEIVKYDTTEPASEDLAKRIRQRLEMPNPRNDSFRSFIEPVVEDILVLDAGCIENVRSLRGEIVELYPVDGATIKVSATWDGSDPDEPRYFWYPDWQERARFKNEDMIYIMANPRTYSVVGLSPLETLKMAIDAELTSNEYNRRIVVGASPDGLLDLGEGARPEDVDRFKSYWSAEVAGKGAMGFIGNTKGAKFIDFRKSNQDMEFMKWQEYLVRKIAAVFGLSPQDLGLTFDVNRSTSETQSQNTDDRGHRPLMALLQDYMTREIVWSSGFGGPDNNLAFRFTALNLKESKAKADINHLALAGIPWKTIDEARVEDGRQPLGGIYERLIAMGPQGPVNLDEVPSAQDVIDSKKPAPGMSAAPSKPASRPASKKSFS